MRASDPAVHPLAVHPSAGRGTLANVTAPSPALLAAPSTDVLGAAGVPASVTASDRDAAAGAADWLDREQQDRWSRLLRAQDRDDFLAARIAADAVVRRLLPDSPDLPARSVFVQRCESCGGPHGRPRLPGIPLAVSWAHARGWVIAAAHRGERLGVDIDLLDAHAPIADSSPVSGRHFVRAEALVKAGAYDLDTALETALDWPESQDHRHRGLLVRDLQWPGGLIGALACD